MMDLIGILESANSGSRELDARVEVAALTGHCWIKLPNDEHRLRNGQVLVKGFPEELTAFADAEPVTTSLDAAIDLVERVLPNSVGDVSLGRKVKHRARISVFASNNYDPDKFTAWADTPPLALCIALLKALQAKEAGQ